MTEARLWAGLVSFLLFVSVLFAVSLAEVRDSGFTGVAGCGLSLSASQTLVAVRALLWVNYFFLLIVSNVVPVIIPMIPSRSARLVCSGPVFGSVFVEVGVGVGVGVGSVVGVGFAVGVGSVVGVGVGVGVGPAAM